MTDITKAFAFYVIIRETLSPLYPLPKGEYTLWKPDINYFKYPYGIFEIIRANAL